MTVNQDCTAACLLAVAASAYPAAADAQQAWLWTTTAQFQHQLDTRSQIVSDTDSDAKQRPASPPTHTPVIVPTRDRRYFGCK
jgi:hypothetical protein